MAMGIQTNKSALSALQNLNRTQNELEVTQRRVSSGLEVAESKDNAPVFAVSETMRADVSALEAVTGSINRASTIGEIGLAAATNISDLLILMREKALAATDSALDATSRAALNEDFRALIGQVQAVLDNAEFDGANLINNSLPGGVLVMADADAQRTMTLAPQDLTMGGPLFIMPDTADISTEAGASATLAQIRTSADNVNAAITRMAADVNKLDAHRSFVGQLMDSLTNGIGQLVDANMAEEAARLQSLQVRQQLGVESLSIANRAPEAILSLFR